MATASGNANIVRSLLSHGAHANVADEEGDTPAHWAVREGNLEILKLLVQNGAHVDLANEDGETPLQLAADVAEKSMVEFLTRASRKDFKFTNADLDDGTPQFVLDY